MDSLSHRSCQLPIGPILEVGAEFCVHVLSIYCNFVWFGLVYSFCATLTNVSLYVELLCCVS